MHKGNEQTVSRSNWRFFGKSPRRLGKGSRPRSTNGAGESNRLFQYVFAEDDEVDEDWRSPVHVSTDWTGHLEFCGDQVETISRRCELHNGYDMAEVTDDQFPIDASNSHVHQPCHEVISAPSSVGQNKQCHWNRPVTTTSKAARNRLITSCILCAAFLIAEVVGGYYANSLAIMTDAAHLLSDLTSFLISLFALWIGSKAPTKTMSFGYHRAEVIGAAVSVLLIWSLTGVLIYSAVKRVIEVDYIINSDIMLLVSSIGIAINIVMAVVLHGTCDDHVHTDTHGGHTHEAHGEHQPSDNINVRAAFVHVLGDFVQSIGVFLAAVVIKIKPEYKLADPICTFLFSSLVVLTTVNIIRDTVLVLMEGFPRTVDSDKVEKVLTGVYGIRSVHDLHVWSLTMDKYALVAHIVIDDEVDFQSILHEAENTLKQNKCAFHHVTIQVERISAVVADSCR